MSDSVVGSVAPRPSRGSGSISSTEVMIDRQALADELAEFIVASPARLIVLQGRRSSGKTALVRTGIEPALQRLGRRVAYGDCAPNMPVSFETAAGPSPLAPLIAGDAIVILDSVDHLFDLPRDEHAAIFDSLFDGLFPQADAGRARSKLVLVVDSRHLTAAHVLAAADPRVPGVVKEIQPIGLRDGLDQLRRLDPAALAVSSEVLTRLRSDATSLADRGFEVTIDLLKLFLDQLRAATPGDEEAEITLATYQRVGGVEGMLRTYLDERMERIATESPEEARIAQAIVNLVVDSRDDVEHPAFDQLARRLPAEPAAVERVLQRLIDDPDVFLLRRTEDLDYEMLPPQLGVVVADRMMRRRPDIERAQRLVDEGLRSWQRLGTAMPRERLVEVHAMRCDLTPDDDALRFLLRSTLGHATGELRDAPRYWLDRLSDPDDGMDLLLVALFDGDAAVRRRAAVLLARFREPEVTDRLFILAVTDADADAEVRAAAIASLAQRRDDALRARVLQVVDTPGQPRRREAIELLQVFAEAPIAERLEALVNNPDTPLDEREMAIHVLSRLAIPESVDALVRIAMDDEDPEDRDASAKALGTLEAEPLISQVLERLAATSTRARGKFTRIAIGLVAIVLEFLGAAFFMGSIGVGGASPWLYVAVSLLLVFAAGRALRRASEARAGLRTGPAVAPTASFVLGTLMTGLLLCGVAHAGVGQWRRAARHLGVWVFGGVMIVVGGLLVPGGSALSLFYISVGVVIMLFACAADLVGALGLVALHRRSSEAARRRRLVHRQVLANAVAARLLLRRLDDPNVALREQARDLVTWHGGALHPAELVDALERPGGESSRPVLAALARHREEPTIRRLEAIWRKADVARRKAIATAFWTRPNERSLEALDRLAPEMARRDRWRAMVARWQFWMSVWPWPGWVALGLMVPVGVLLLYHGYNSVSNKAWSQIQVVRSRGASDELKIATVEFLAKNHPGDAGPYLLTMLDDGTFVEQDQLHSALLLGVLDIREQQPYAESVDSTVRRVVRDATLHFSTRLASNDSVAFVASLEALGGVALQRDSLIAAAARTRLFAFVKAGRGFSPPERRLLVAGAIGGLPAYLGLPLLDSLLRTDQEPETKVKLSQQIERIALHAIEELPTDSIASQGELLLETLARLKSTTPALGRARTALRLSVGEARTLTGATNCKAGAKVCAERSRALAMIDSLPGAEEGFAALVDAYGTSYDELALALDMARERHASSVWPAKTLSTLYLEKLAIRDTGYFARSFQAASAVRAAPGYPAMLDTPTRRRFEADFAEIALAAGEFDALRQAAAALLADSDEPRERLNMALFLYIAAVVQRDGTEAMQQFEALKQIMAGLDEGLYNGWRYDGTVRFIETRGLPAPMQKALIALCREGYWFPRREADAVLEQNQRALRELFAERKR